MPTENPANEIEQNANVVPHLTQSEEEIAAEIAECIEAENYAHHCEEVELRWAARAIHAIRLGMVTSANEYPQQNAILEDATIRKLNRAIRAAAGYLDRCFSSKGLE